MQEAIHLLNTILETTCPGETVRLSVDNANLLARLDDRELGGLIPAISCLGVCRALETQGLFSRRILIVDHELECSWNEPVGQMNGR